MKTDGYYGSTTSAARAISMDFSREQRATSVFDYAVASKGQVISQKGAVTSVTEPAIRDLDRPSLETIPRHRIHR